MENAKEEFLDFIKGESGLIAASITIKMWEGKPDKICNLKKGHTTEDFDKFLDSLVVKNEYGYYLTEQEGYIWFEDGTWGMRDTYDGTEWWAAYKLLEIPKELL